MSSLSHERRCCCGLCTDAFVGFRKCSIVPALRVFIMNGVKLYQVLYLHLLRSSYFFLLYFVKVVSDTDFECEAGSPSRDKLLLVAVEGFVSCGVGSERPPFYKHFCICVHKRCWSLIPCSCYTRLMFCIGVICPHRMSWEPFPFFTL